MNPTSNINYYEILNSTPNATYEELKRNYQKLAKLNHPDKQTSPITGTKTEKFQQIDEAWKVLRDVQQRKIYDSTRVQSDLQQTAVIYAEISTDCLSFDCDCLAFYQCRCGENIEIHQENFQGLAKGEEVLFECSECSNNILVTVA